MTDTPTQAIDEVVRRLCQQGDATALVADGRDVSYAAFVRNVDAWRARLETSGIGAGAVCGVLGDYSPNTCALFFALMQAKAVMVPLTRLVENELPEFMAIAGVERLFRFDADDRWTLESFAGVARNDLVASFSERGAPGLIVFTSGSTGRPKGILHDCDRVMHKFVARRPGWRTVLFLMMDHFGGFNTFLSTFAWGGTAVCVSDRRPDAVCRVIEQSKATLLPTTPTFLNLLLASASYRDFDLSSIRLITYGTEVMPEATLTRIATMFPNAQIKQTYGLSELGVLRSKSENDGSVWVKIGGDGFEVKIADGVLWVRSEANMVGYLNAPSPFDGEGWMCTGDRVEVNGEYMRFLGRESDLINVGGQKVFPLEVETILLQADNIREATVHGVSHPLMGKVVHARVSLMQPEDPERLTERLRSFCVARLARYKVPVRFTVVSADEQRSARFKKIR